MMYRKTTLVLGWLLVFVRMGCTSPHQSDPICQQEEIHKRRVVVNYDIGARFFDRNFEGNAQTWEDYIFSYADEPGTHIDSLWFCIDEGNFSFYPSTVLPMSKCAQIMAFWNQGVDLLRVAVEGSHSRGMEAFYTYRLNGYDGEFVADGSMVRPIPLPMKEQHPDWLLADSWPPEGAKLWNFDIEGVRTYKVKILRELAENYDWDGLDIDFARHPPSLPLGQQWNCRDSMTDFIRKVRQMLNEVGRVRGRSYLLSVRVPCTLQGCHYDGYDIETWAKEGLIDLMVIGVHSIDVDLEAFQRIIAGTGIKLYPCMDDRAHPPDGYSMNLEFERGIASTWWRQGADGICTFNWLNDGPSPHQQAYHEIGDPDVMRFKNKFFVLPRRHGGGWDETWMFYQNNNLEAPLPATLVPGVLPAIFHMNIGDDIAGYAHRVSKVDLRLQLSGTNPDDPIEVKLNGVLLAKPTRQGDWWIFQPEPRSFALGRNIICIRTTRAITLEKLEVHVSYKAE